MGSCLDGDRLGRESPTAEDDPPFSRQRDLRSPSKAKDRYRKQKQKYYAHRAVHPSWVGQPYYTLVPVTEETVSWAKEKRTHRFHAAEVIEIEHQDLADMMRCNVAFPFSDTLDSIIEHAISEIRNPLTPRERTFYADGRHVAYTPDFDRVHTLEAPRALSVIDRTIFSAGRRMPWPENVRFKLKICQWTKQDNFDHKERFTWGPDRRHHKSRRIREKGLQKWTLSCLGRKTKQKSAEERAAAQAADDCAEDREVLASWASPEDGCELCKDGAAHQVQVEIATSPPSMADEDDEEPQSATSEGSLSETFSLLESQLSSSAVVIQVGGGEDDTDSLVDVDALSDIDGAFYELDLEWEIVSDSGSIGG